MYSVIANSQSIPQKTFSMIPRMAVPKMVENGFNSVPSVRITYRSIDSEWNQKQRAKAKRGINNF